MDTNNNIAEEVKSALDSITHIQEIKTPPFFKDKTMRKLFDAKVAEEKIVFSWFTPKLQLATLVCIIALNAFCLNSIKKLRFMIVMYPILGRIIVCLTIMKLQF